MSIKSAKAGNCKTRFFADVMKLFQEFDKQLEYPNCEGYADEKRITQRIEDKFFVILEDNDPNT
jgi:hypothetical protein